MLLQRFNLSLILFLITCTVLAAPNKKMPSAIEIQSDAASVQQLTRQAVHEGNVVMKQGDNTLYADKLIIQKDEKGALSEITAIGKPATFKGTIFASAKTIHYYPAKQLILLEGDATLIHQQDKFHGPTLSYQIDKQVVFATKSNQERPTIIFHPQV